MQGEDALRTVECLRGRLQAERAASREAKESAELMDNKLKKLEEQLKIETKCRRKAEKKLNILKKKLERLNIGFSVAEESDGQYSSSDHSEQSCISSTASAGENAEQTEKTKAKAETNGESKLQDIESLHGMKESALGEKTNKSENEVNEQNEGDYSVDNSMALVPVSFALESNTTSNRSETKANSESVRQVLDNLKQIRENIQSTIERRRIIKVG